MGVIGVGMNRHHLTIFDFGLKDAPMRAMGMDAASTHRLPPNNLSQPVGTPAPLLATGRFCEHTPRWTAPDAWSLPQVLADLGIVSSTGDVPDGQISPPEDAASAPSESITEREWSAIAGRRLFLAASLVKVAALLLWRVRAGALA